MKFTEIYRKIVENYVDNIIEVFINGIGSAIAEADTGNSGYNVLHGKVLDIENGRVSFYTLNNKLINKPVVEYITAVTGSSDKEKRPVVLFDITVNGMPHTSIPFSISDRSENEQKILLGKPFLKEITSFVRI
jgi:hypothetical protein